MFNIPKCESPTFQKATTFETPVMLRNSIAGHEIQPAMVSSAINRLIYPDYHHRISPVPALPAQKVRFSD
jgi:hypothetical protein